MRKVGVTEAKNGLSGLLAEVGRGEVVLIMHRGTPVARIEPYRTSELDDDAAVADLIGRGIADPPESPCELDELAAMPSPVPSRRGEREPPDRRGARRRTVKSWDSSAL